MIARARHHSRWVRRRGLTLVELILALAVTALIAGAIAGMMAAVTNGVQVRRDSRTVSIRASAAHSRLDAYLSACHCLLEVEDNGVVLWLNDDRESETVHASEIRWLLHDDDEGAIDVYYVDFPAAWTDLQRDLSDREFKTSADWLIILGQYEARGLISHVRLVDGIASLAIETDEPDAMDARLITYDLELTDGDRTAVIRATSAVTNHQEPTS